MDGCAILEHTKDEVIAVFSFNHFNFNVSDLDKSLAFYKEALGLEPVRRKEAEDGSVDLIRRAETLDDYFSTLVW